MAPRFLRSWYPVLTALAMNGVALSPGAIVLIGDGGGLIRGEHVSAGLRRIMMLIRHCGD